MHPKVLAKNKLPGQFASNLTIVWFIQVTLPVNDSFIKGLAYVNVVLFCLKPFTATLFFFVLISNNAPSRTAIVIRLSS